MLLLPGKQDCCQCHLLRSALLSGQRHTPVSAGGAGGVWQWQWQQSCPVLRVRPGMCVLGVTWGVVAWVMAAKVVYGWGGK